MRYVLDFGSVNAGGSPAFTIYKRLSDGLDQSPPAIVEIGGGLYYFDVDVTSETLYKATLNGVELSDVLQPTASTGPSTPPSIGSASAATAFPVAGDVLNRVASAVGLGRVADPYASTDSNFTQMQDLLVELGGDLLNVAKPWPQLVLEKDVTTVSGQTFYPAPSDFHRFVEQTGWNRSTRRPLAGPALPTEWQKLLAWRMNSTFNITFRQTPLGMTVYPSPVDGIQIAYEYVSKYWAQRADGTLLLKPSQSSDLVLFDDLTLVRGLKLKFLTARGFDTTVAATEYRDALESAISRASGANKLSVSRRTGNVGPYAATPDGIVY